MNRPEGVNFAEAVKKCGSVSAAARELGYSRTSLDRWLEKEREEKGSPAKTVKAQPKKKGHRGLTEEELLLRYSAEHKIAHEAKEISKGTFISEAEFLRGMRLPGGYRHVVEREEFQRFRGRAPGGVWYWGHPERIAAMKADGVLR